MINSDKAVAELCKRSFYFFLREFWGEIIQEPLIDNWHIKYLCDELQAVAVKIAAREPKDYDLIINIPPSTSKSTIATIMFPVWIWLLDKTIRTITSSYSNTLSVEHTVKSRDIIQSDKFQRLFNIPLRKDLSAKSHYKNEHGGERYTTSVGGSITGMHAHLIIVDDPLNPKEAVSEVERDGANSYLSATLSTRKVNKLVTPTILIMQRLHEDDPTGYLLKQVSQGKSIKHICLPAEDTGDVLPSDLKRFYINGMLDVNRMGKDVLNELKISLGSYNYAGQIMQSPAPKGGGIWKAWFKTFNDDTEPKNEDGESLVGYIGTDWDLAYTEKETNSASAYVTSGKYDGRVYVYDIGFKWLEFPALIEWMRATQSPHYIEGKASGKSAKQVLVNSGIAAMEVEVKGGDKIARATMASPYAEAGLVYVHERVIDELLNNAQQGLLKFPNTGTDLNDAFVQAINRHLGGHQTFFF